MMDSDPAQDGVGAPFEKLAAFGESRLADWDSRFERVDQKASSLLSALTIVIGAAGFFGNQVLDQIIPAESILEIAMVIVGSFVGLLLLAAWTCLFATLRTRMLETLTFDKDLIRWAVDRPLVEFHRYVAIRCAEALELNIPVVRRKTRFLQRGYRLTLASVALLLSFTALYLWYRWTHPTTL